VNKVFSVAPNLTGNRESRVQFGLDSGTSWCTRTNALLSSEYRQGSFHLITASAALNALSFEIRTFAPHCCRAV
jgi:hypothetical protein